MSDFLIEIIVDVISGLVLSIIIYGINKIREHKDNRHKS